MAQTVLPPVPQLPKIWSPQNILIFVAAGATFVVGVLAELGHVLPAGTTSEVATISGVAAQVGALATAMLTLFSHNSTVASVSASQAAIHVANINGTIAHVAQSATPTA